MDPKYEKLLARFVEKSREILGQNLVGIYLHGSAAMGCFNGTASDIDLIVVVEDAPSKDVKRRYMDFVAALNDHAPAKGIELSVVKRAACKPFQYPTPFALHFSIAHLAWYRADPEDYLERMRGTDQDLAAHFTVINHRGKTLYGADIADVFGPVEERYYFDSIWNDIADAEREIMANPVYVVLNLCRVLAFAKDRLVLSKREGGQWGLQNLPPRYGQLAAEALAAYAGAAPLTVEPNTAEAYAGYMLASIQNYREEFL